MSGKIHAILLDIEGTVAPISFVKQMLFPYAQEKLESFVTAHRGDALLAEVERLEPEQDPLTSLRGWMGRDEKITVLKTIQGMIWKDGYESGAITAELYPDVTPALQSWHEAGLNVNIYSSGSVPAQKLLFGHTRDGDLTSLFQGFFDTERGPKQAMASYLGICRSAGITPASCLFLSDVEAELDAAAEAGLQTCQLVRPQDKTIASTRHETAANLDEVSSTFGLPQAPQSRSP